MFGSLDRSGKAARVFCQNSPEEIGMGARDGT